MPCTLAAPLPCSTLFCKLLSTKHNQGAHVDGGPCQSYSLRGIATEQSWPGQQRRMQGTLRIAAQGTRDRLMRYRMGLAQSARHS